MAKPHSTNSRRYLTAKPIEIRLWNFVEKTDNCWIWLGSKDKHGYGSIRFRGKVSSTHRVAYILTKGEIPDNLLVCHSCDNPPCCNPEHLFLGTIRDNAIDCANKGRNFSQLHPERMGVDWSKHPESLARGTRNGSAKLNEQKVREIRAMAATGMSSRKIAKHFGIAERTAFCVIKRIRWKHVE